MPLNATVLANLMDTKMPPLPTEEAKAERLKSLTALAQAIVEHITTAGVVAVVSVSGVTPGGGVSGPGTGTIT